MSFAKAIKDWEMHSGKARYDRCDGYREMYYLIEAEVNEARKLAAEEVVKQTRVTQLLQKIVDNSNADSQEGSGALSDMLCDAVYWANEALKEIEP